MATLEFIRRQLGISLSLQKGLNIHNVAKEKLDNINQEINLLQKSFSGTKSVFEEAIKEIPEKSDFFNKRFNNAFSDYLEDLKTLKSKKQEELDLIQYTLDNTIGLKEYFENQKKYVFKEYLGSSLGYYRKDLPQVSYKDLDKMLFLLKDEKITLNKAEIPISILKPAQVDFDTNKIDNIIRDGMEDNNFVPIVSKDLYILDGHHRWAALLQESEDTMLKVHLINLPMDILIKKIENYNKEIKKAFKIIYTSIENGQINKSERETKQSLEKSLLI